MNELCQDLLRELFDYRDDGVLIRKSTGNAVLLRDNYGYVNVRINGSMYKAHQVVWLWHHGRVPSETDHINHVRHDNRIENLREVSHQQNMSNKRGKWYYDRNERFTAIIQYRGVQRNLGTFGTAEEAQAVYARAKSEILMETLDE